MKPAQIYDADDVELALARLEWARAAGCLHLPSQQDALQWHLAQCADAPPAVDPETPDRPGG